MQYILDRILAEEEAARDRIRQLSSSTEADLQRTRRECSELVEKTKRDLGEAFNKALQEHRKQAEDELKRNRQRAQEELHAQLDAQREAVEQLARKAADHIIHGDGC